MLLINKSVQEDLYSILQHDVGSLMMQTKPSRNLVIYVSENESMKYPYDNREDLESDYNTLVRVIKKIKNK